MECAWEKTVFVVSAAVDYDDAVPGLVLLVNQGVLCRDIWNYLGGHICRRAQMVTDVTSISESAKRREPRFCGFYLCHIAHRIHLERLRSISTFAAMAA